MFKTQKYPVPFSRRTTLLIVLCGLVFGGCATHNAPHSNGMGAIDLDPSLKGPVSGVGIEGRDIVAMSDQMMRDLLSTHQLVNRDAPPRIILDASQFENSSSQSIDKSMITDRMRTALNRSAKGRMVFLGRNYAKRVEEERELKRSGITDEGTIEMKKNQAGVDYILGGKMTSLDSRNGKTGMQQRYVHINFEMFDAENSVIVWSGDYEFARAAADDVVYR